MEIRKVTIDIQFIIVLALIFIGVAFRFLPHEPNFAPISAIALFGGAMLSWRKAIWLPLLVLMVSDSVLGNYSSIGYTWGAFLLIALFGMLFRHAKFVPRVLLGGVGGSIIFFVVSNLGTWITTSDMYAHTLPGLIQCFAAGIPFFRPSLTSGLFYSAVLFGSYELATWTVRIQQLKASSETKNQSSLP